MTETKKTIVSMQTEERVFAPHKHQSEHTFIGSLDMLIAARALSLGSTLVTNNTKEFARVPGPHLKDGTR
ncbi:MAG: hypothetical protein HZA03_11365 [Nitrospinae bacterium]|nr:hypothetical protein [Nitrospinota bacterium]